MRFFIKIFSKSLVVVLILLSGITINTLAQEESGKLKKSKGFQVGLYVGSFFANHATAQVYDGFGFDGNGNKNDFYESFLYNQINYYGGKNNFSQLPDQIAPALSVNGQFVNSDGWSFDLYDMPLEMRYTPSLMIGLATRYFVDGKNSLIFNLNVTQLTATGGFTITLNNQPNIAQAYQTFPIRGKEQRMMFQLGYQRIFGNHEKANLFAEAGINMTMAKADKNEVMINNLYIDLMSYFNVLGNQQLFYQKPVSVNIGAFAGLGINLTMSNKWTIQVLYSPVYERLTLGYDTGLHLQHGAGLRAYYHL